MIRSPDLEFQSTVENLKSHVDSSEREPIKALGAIPGYAMTQPKGQGAWEQPPQITDPNEAVDAVIDTFEDNKTNISKLIFAGVSIEEIINVTTFNAFMSGKFTPDIAELIKPALAVYLVDMADRLDIPFKMFTDAYEEDEIEDEELFRIMKKRNPEMYTNIRKNINEELRMGKEREANMSESPAPPSNFLEMGEAV